MNNQDNIIQENYEAIIARNPEYKYTREEHKQWCINLLIKNHDEAINFIEGWTIAHKRGGVYHR